MRQGLPYSGQSVAQCVCGRAFTFLPPPDPAMAKGKWKKWKSDEVRTHMAKKKHAVRVQKYRKKKKEEKGYDTQFSKKRLWYANNKKRILKKLKKQRVAARK